MGHDYRRRWSARMGAVTFALLIGTATTGLAMANATTSMDPAESGLEKIRARDSTAAIPNSYLVVLPQTVSAQLVHTTAEAMIEAYGGTLRTTYDSALRGFSVEMDEAAAAQLALDPGVSFVEQNQEVSLTDPTANDTQLDATWGLDRIDQRELPLDGTYTYETTAPSVAAYVIDTGIQPTHQEFGGRATAAFDAIGDGQDGVDCNGHGTHVAGTIGGTEFGVAKEVALVGVRVLDCGGSGTTEGVVAGIDWVTENATAPAVANMSLGGLASDALDAAVVNSIASGIPYSIAAGNSNVDACTVSPARVPEALTVAASDSEDIRASFSNFGECVDVFAPGVGITSAWIGSDTAVNTISGTSMAAPHVAGGVALYLEVNPEATPEEIDEVLVAHATPDLIEDPGVGTPNLLLYVGP
ncbi:S8 family peptidase [Actinoalloteichus hymeniacidonis]|uniref:Subtilisin-like serine protease n=1 Tax=Actinoalloteichus hymeniacidonis TaxID=340345 RepID=A0AAC9HMZ9_9PSEU|nr:S8 family peptidase [Actinoalloteichus hymeniacidonis]AOS62299.1 subtilisin-like serine protease [Actinoalloteichus hymeniacidonis]MBB5909675.1 subtilisin family serine protease [Actinoalloteichus hymeniacidonis]